MDKKYEKTIAACFVGYIVQGIVNNFVPLLFVTLQMQYSISLSLITLITTLNFGMQLMVDFVSMGFVARFGYRKTMITAHVCAAAGLLLLTVLPEILPSAFAGILIAVMVYALGGGLLEVLLSPIVEACPTRNKEAAMSMLHSFYCWGQLGVVVISTLFFFVFGRDAWKAMAIIWALVPALNTIFFARVALPPVIEQDSEGMSLRELLHLKIFWVLMVMMLCSGAAEQAINQWSSTFAEEGLGITKTAGDLLGPALFALLMGLSRAFYGTAGSRINLDRFMLGSCVLCCLAYLGATVLDIPLLNLLSCALCGLSVGIMWPGSFSIAAKMVPKGATAMYAMLALAGDLGCSSGPTLVGFISSAAGDNLKIGILAGICFPIVLFACVVYCARARKSNSTDA